MRIAVRKIISASLVTVLLGAASALYAADLFRSNAVGIQGARLGPDDPDPPDFVLEVSRAGGAEIRRLLNEGAEVSRTEIVRDGTTVTERTFEDDLLKRESVRRDDGTLIREALYAAGDLTERWQFTYEGDLLVSREVLGPDDLLMYRESYSYWRDGTLRNIVKTEQGDQRTEYRYRDGRLEEEWISRPGEAERFEFDRGGRLAIRERFVEDDLVEQEVRLYWADDSGSLLREVVVSAGDRVTRRGYDERGRLTSERVEESGDLVRELERTFTDDLLTGEVETDSQGQRSWEYAYGEEGDRERETYREDGSLVEVTYLALEPGNEPADRIVELFNRDEPILRIYYEGRLRLKEEVIRDGEVIRTREFATDSGEAAASDGGE